MWLSIWVLCAVLFAEPSDAAEWSVSLFSLLDPFSGSSKASHQTLPTSSTTTVPNPSFVSTLTDQQQCVQAQWGVANTLLRDYEGHSYQSYYYHYYYNYYYNYYSDSMAVSGGISASASHRQQTPQQWQYGRQGDHEVGQQYYYAMYYGYYFMYNEYRHVDILRQRSTKVKWTGAVLDSITMVQSIVDCLSSSAGCLLLSSMWSLLVMIMSSRQAFRTAAARTWAKTVAFCQELYGDLRTLVRAWAVMCSEILFVTSKRSCCCRRRLRQFGLRLRAYQPGQEDPEDDILLATPRRTLSQIQQDGGLVMGGAWCRAHQPRTMGRVRLPSPRRRNWRVCYNPRTPGECLYACVQRIAQLQGRGRISTQALRALAKVLLSQAQHEDVAGQ
eukprot:2984807-Amphidinium_carterae.1